MPSKSSKRTPKRGLQVNVEIDDEGLLDLFLRYKAKEIMPTNAATGKKIFGEFLRQRASELQQVQPASS